MPGWDTLVELLRDWLVVLAHAFGGSLGSAIVALSVAARLLLLPLGVRVALRARAIQARMAALEPQLQRLRERHRDDPMELMRRTQALRERHGIEAVPKGMFASVALQLPIGAALYAAIGGGFGAGQRFLWLADLAQPDALLAGVTAALAAGATVAAQGESPARMAAHVPVLLSVATTLFFVWRLASGVGVYWAASSLVSVAQGLIVRRLAAREGETPK